MSKLSATVGKETLPPFWLKGLDGLNQHDARSSIGDQECFWMENFMPLGAGNARTMYDKAANTYTAGSGKTVIYFYPFNISTTYYHAVFLSDGSAVAVNQATGATAAMGSTGTFATGPTLPCCAQYGASGIVFVTAASSGYYAWDGTLYAPGATAPTWLTGGTTATMPTGLSGTALEVYASHVWIINGATCTFSAVSNGANFSTAAGGGTFTSTDSFLRTRFVNIKQSNGFLYLFGDSSINVISNVQTSGSTPTTTFNNQNVDPLTGITWRDTLVAFGRTLVFANQTGVYALYGGAAEKISDKLDNIFASADFVSLTPSTYVDNIFGVRVLGFLFRTTDPFGVTRNLVALWNGKKWFIGSQSATLVFVATSGYSQNPSAWATDGTSIFQPFHVASATLVKKIQSKLWEGSSNIVYKGALRVYAESKDNSSPQTGAVLTGTLDSDVNNGVPFSLTSNVSWINNAGDAVQWQNNLAQNVNWLSSPPGIIGTDISASGRRLGITLQTTSPDITIIGTGMLYEERTIYG